MLKLDCITKYFPGVKALDNVSLCFNPGKIHALVGENGAGKSTLMRIVSGIYSDYEGIVSLNGRKCVFKNYHDATNWGISIVNQEIQVILESSVAENIMLDKLERYRTKYGRLDWNQLEKDAGIYMNKVGLDLSPGEIIGPLSAAQKQLAQIAKSLAAEASVILFDEPTSSITKHEAETLFRIMEELRDEGKIIIYVSHKLEEVFRISDQISVIRDGHLIGTEATNQLDRDRVVEMMIGREIMNSNLGSLNIDKHNLVLETKKLTNMGVIDDISFSLRKGEILGFYGLVGAGRTETARVILGLDNLDSGEVWRNGNKVIIKDVSEALYKYKIGYVTENRKEEGLWLDFDVERNITVTIWHRIVIFFSRFIRRRPSMEITRNMIDNLAIKVTDSKQLVKQLSGGNQQKVSLSKWLAAECDVLIIDEPTVGVDVGAKDSIHHQIWNLAKLNGVSIILISSDLSEMIKLARRILVFRDGRIISELDDLSGNPEDNEKVSNSIGQLLV